MSQYTPKIIPGDLIDMFQNQCLFIKNLYKKVLISHLFKTRILISSLWQSESKT